MTSASRDAAAALRDRLMSWLRSEALPIWWAFGYDHVNGGFHEKLGLRCEIRSENRRTRVIARQVFSFAVAGRIGWTGPWRRAVEEGLDYFIDRCIRPEDGTVRMVVSAEGEPVDDTFNLYDQAFALFAFAAAASTMADRSKAERAAVRLRDELLTRYKHPVAGFEEALTRTLPLKANPHMHLFEACLAWEEAGGDARWSSLADEIADLCLTRMIDARQGWLKEFFDGDWAPIAGEAGRICEPGHHFEWAWLLVRWGLKRNRPDAIAAARRLADLMEAQGMNRTTGVAIMEILDDGAIRDGTARLWSQTERMKGHLALAGVSATPAEADAHMQAAVAAGEALLRFFAVDTPGLWYDRMEPDGRFRVEPAPASSFYHIVCAIEELDKALAA